MATSTLGSGTLVLAGTTSGTTTVTATAVAGTTTLTLPAATDTLVGKATTDTLTNKTLTGAVMNGTLGVTTPSTVAATTLTTSSTVTHNGGTANGVAYLDGSKVLTTGSALVFDGANLGVGTTTPDIFSRGYGRIVGINDSGSSGAALEINSASSYPAIELGRGGVRKAFFTAQSTATEFGNLEAVPLVFYTNSAERMRLDSSGNLGIGTSSPTTPLQIQSAAATGVNSIFCTGSTTSFNFWTISNTSGNARIGVDSSSGGALATGSAAYSTVIGSSTATPLHLISNGAVRATIDSSGTFSQTTSASGNSFQSNNSNASPVGVLIRYTTAAPNNTGAEFLVCNDSGTTRMTIRSNGGIANYSANNVNLSDRREKTNFAPASSYLDKICAIPVQTFNYIDQNIEEDAGLTLGVVAQDVQAVAPEMVMESNWGTEEEPKMRLSIYQTDLQYALMKCIQEQQALITQLTARITALESA